jgi:hypothetical protein
VPVIEPAPQQPVVKAALLQSFLEANIIRMQSFSKADLLQRMAEDGRIMDFPRYNEDGFFDVSANSFICRGKSYPIDEGITFTQKQFDKQRAKTPDGRLDHAQLRAWRVQKHLFQWARRTIDAAVLNTILQYGRKTLLSSTQKDEIF